ncbi:hypothetical protein AB0B13_19010 [Streptomyces sp. NPDC042898]|uniref:hypothetical protein n=1 Tax=Streptomyces sp. NPDC042898 TaxID=3154334 RepID=UPI0033E82DBF
MGGHRKQAAEVRKPGALSAQSVRCSCGGRPRTTDAQPAVGVLVTSASTWSGLQGPLESLTRPEPVRCPSSVVCVGLRRTGGVRVVRVREARRGRRSSRVVRRWAEIWNRDHISHVQIDVPEHIDIQGRAHFFQGTGTFRDMIVTHLFQLLGFIATEPPATLDANSLRAEKDKVFQSLRPVDPARVVRGRYDVYSDEPGVDPASDTETLVALCLEIDNWHWAGVPFYLRSGKDLAASRPVITLGFREPPLRMFPLAAQESAEGRHNELIIDFNDPGTITARFLAKKPGPDMRLTPADMVFDYADSFSQDHALEGYERLILDAMLGDQSLFTDATGIERLWEVAAALLDSPPPVEPYAKGSWGPDSLPELVRPHHWHLPRSS